jgi:hypothetical protein
MTNSLTIAQSDQFVADSDLLPEDLRKELKVDEQGKGFVSLRGIARMCGLSMQSFRQGGSIFNQNIDEMLTGKGFEGDSILTPKGIPDTIATLVIEYYAFDAGKRCTEQARNLFRAIANIGLREVIRKSIGWEQTQITKLLTLPVPSVWQKRYPDVFYDELYRLTNLTKNKDAKNHPRIFAHLTNKYVYAYMPPDTVMELRRLKLDSEPSAKLHQGLSENGLFIWNQHMQQLLTLMITASSFEMLDQLLLTSRTRNYQLLLMY